jgi:hypothetical protein
MASFAQQSSSSSSGAQSLPPVVIASRLGWLSKEMGDTGAAQRHFSRSRTDGREGPVVTYAIIALTVALSSMQQGATPSDADLVGMLKTIDEREKD